MGDEFHGVWRRGRGRGGGRRVRISREEGDGGGGAVDGAGGGDDETGGRQCPILSQVWRAASRRVHGALYVGRGRR